MSDQGYTYLASGCPGCVIHQGGKVLRPAFVIRERLGHRYWTCPMCDGSYGEVTDAARPPVRLLQPQPAPTRDVVPGKVRCAKCAFSLQRVNLYLGSGTTGPGGEEVEPCPNDGSPLLPVTWEQESREAWTMAEQQFDRAKALEAALAELVACKDLKDEESRQRQRREVAIVRNREAVARVDAMRDDYNRRKPLAWAAARALLPKGPTHV